MNIEWDGEGAPQVGQECQIKLGPYWTQVKVLAYFSGQAVVGWICQPEGESCIDLMDVSELRPILTLQQIAANKRLHEIRNACTTINSKIEQYNVSIDCSVAMRATLEAMIDAGYRKFEIVEEDV